MSLHFPRSLDSLQTDGTRPLYTTIGLAFVLLLLWAFWFCAAKITRYESGQIIQTTPDGLIIAEFPARAFNRLQLDQPAWLYPQDTGVAPSKPIAATVYTLPEQPASVGSTGRFQVELASNLDSQNELAFATGFTGEVMVEVEYVSPLALVVGQ